MTLKLHKRRLIYLVLIIGIGGIGCWIAAAQHFLRPSDFSGYSFCDNLATFSISLAVMAFADYLVISQDRFQPTAALCRLACTALAVVAGVVPLVLKQGLGVASAWLSFAAAMLVWWLVHTSNQNLDDQLTAVSTLGGKV